MQPQARIRLVNYPYSALSNMTYNQGEIVYDETNATLRLLDGRTAGGIPLANQAYVSAYVAGVQTSLTQTLQNYTNQQIAAINSTIALTGDVSGTGTLGNSFNVTLANSGVTAGSYAAVTVNSKGVVTGGSSLSVSGDATGTTALAITGYKQTFSQDIYGNTTTGAVAGTTTVNVGSNSQLLALLDTTTQFGNLQYQLFNAITMTYADGSTQTFTTCRCTNIVSSGAITFGYDVSTAGHNFPITIQTANYVSATSLILTLANIGVTAGSYTGSVTVNSKGLVTAAAQLTSQDVTTALNYTPVSTQGGTITGALAVQGALTVTANPSQANQVVNKQYVDSKVWLALAVGL